MDEIWLEASDWGSYANCGRCGQVFTEKPNIYTLQDLIVAVEKHFEEGCKS